jgi:hypothetical protein
VITGALASRLCLRHFPATVNWAVFISTGTEIVFQIPHNLSPSLLHANKGSMIEYPFAAYAVADSRWSEYNGGTALIREVCVRARVTVATNCSSRRS